MYSTPLGSKGRKRLPNDFGRSNAYGLPIRFGKRNMSAQNRGDRNLAQFFSPTDSDFTLPYPTNEIAKNPKLLDPPVPYVFN